MSGAVKIFTLNSVSGRDGERAEEVEESFPPPSCRCLLLRLFPSNKVGQALHISTGRCRGGRRGFEQRERWMTKKTEKGAAKRERLRAENARQEVDVSICRSLRKSRVTSGGEGNGND